MEKHIDKMQLVDFVLNQLERGAEENVKRHLQHCETCQKEMEHWQNIFQSENKSEPSRLLDEKVRNIPKLKKYPLRKNEKSKRLFVAISLVASLLFALGLYQVFYKDTPNINETTIQGYIIAQHDAVPEQQLLMEPATDRQSLESLMNHNINGELLLNKETNELILVAEGLIPLEQSDYQLWVVHIDNGWNGQLLQLKNGSTRVYYKVEDISLLKYLKVSVEPEGGSLTPTGPEIFHVDLLNNK